MTPRLARGKGKKFGDNPFIEIVDVEFEEREPYDEEEVFEMVYPLDKMLIIPDYKTVQQAHLELEEGEEPDDEDDEEEPDDDDMPFDEDEEPEDLECPEGGDFGTDFNDLDECEECDLYED